MSFDCFVAATHGRKFSNHTTPIYKQTHTNTGVCTRSELRAVFGKFSLAVCLAVIVTV